MRFVFAKVSWNVLKINTCIIDCVLLLQYLLVCQQVRANPCFSSLAPGDGVHEREILTCHLTQTVPLSTVSPSRPRVTCARVKRTFHKRRRTRPEPAGNALRQPAAPSLVVHVQPQHWRRELNNFQMQLYPVSGCWILTEFVCIDDEISFCVLFTWILNYECKLLPAQPLVPTTPLTSFGLHPSPLLPWVPEGPAKTRKNLIACLGTRKWSKTNETESSATRTAKRLDSKINTCANARKYFRKRTRVYFLNVRTRTRVHAYAHGPYASLARRSATATTFVDRFDNDIDPQWSCIFFLRCTSKRNGNMLKNELEKKIPMIIVS